MNKQLLILSFILSLCALNLQAQDKKHLKIELKNQNIITVDNYHFFSFKDLGNINRKGKIMILNDSQFCFVNYFLEPIGPTFGTNDVYQINLGKEKILGASKISAPTAIVIALFIPGGIYYLIIREAVRLSRNKTKSKENGLEGWIDNKNFKIKIIVDHPQA